MSWHTCYLCPGTEHVRRNDGEVHETRDADPTIFVIPAHAGIRSDYVRKKPAVTPMWLLAAI
ncbi:hypothetical protein EC912_109130 [Luteibacter rhizovicinus]|uniref:Uncharacterized protein n=1 Tax=Luteibacter rhizovicinus TaxID=242606 RepID=A0A4R3YH25_9GAMM|nr:hypothetical protein [Luteibacter rhizovicinus]TCV91895.1 hypothetical protein EC912_109130 [Luteibacter rhizovicinus]